jgi:hypothetical protein
VPVARSGTGLPEFPSDYVVFSPRQRRSPLTPFIDWTDYRFEGPLRRHHAGPRWGYRRHPLLRVLFILALIWVVARLVRGRRHTGWF